MPPQFRHTSAKALVTDFKRRNIVGSHDVALATANFLLRFVSATRYSSTSELISEVRKVGHTLTTAQPREFACGNIVRRVLAIIREVATTTTTAEHQQDGSMFNLLSSASSETKPHQSEAKPKDTKGDIIEGIRELIDEIDGNDERIEAMSLEMIHENEVLLTPTPESKTVKDFLIQAAQKRRFSVLVTESFPNGIEKARAFAEDLTKAGIETVIIPDSTVLAVMSRVGKVVIGARSVLANGGCVSSAGVSLVCECAKENKTPVLAVTGIYKLSPLYPFDIESLIEVGDSGKVVSFSNSDMMSNVEVMNPIYDYVAPEHIDIYITTVGGYSPSFTYRIVLDHYSTEDVSLA
ncbi:translation initiation factor eIF2B subunit beta [Trichomonascus vanleenenianus]|uniref:translation initiation factor eIF2B subunit beta n=1 Tax=Trichomonascus vanleenenianus TaxID=2268995 RepID=UPI003ECAB843